MLRASHGTQRRIVRTLTTGRMNMFSWQRSEVPASTVHCYHTPSASRCSFDLAACRLDWESIRTRPGNISRIHTHEEKTYFKPSLIERHTCGNLISTKWHHLRTMWLFSPDWQFVLCADPPQKTSHSLRINLYLVKNVWSLTLYLTTSPPRVKGLTYLFSVEARRRELRRDELDSQKIQSSGGDETVKWLRGPMG